MPKIAYLQARGDGLPYDGLVFAAFDGFRHLGYDTQFITTRDVLNGDIEPTPETPVIGTIDRVRSMWGRMRVKTPAPLDYPECLRDYLGRAVERRTLGSVRRDIAELTERHGHFDPFFIKPADRHKLFSGFVWRERDDKYKVSHVEDAESVWVSKVTEFQNEMRVFVHEGKIVHACIYDGDPFVTPPDKGVVESAVRDYQASGTAPVAYAIDFASVKEGLWNRVTVLVEVNDFWAVGPYTLATDDYARMLAARWHEVCETSRS
jgi:hypothetical protein